MDACPAIAFSQLSPIEREELSEFCPPIIYMYMFRDLDVLYCGGEGTCVCGRWMVDFFIQRWPLLTSLLLAFGFHTF